LLMLMLG